MIPVDVTASSIMSKQIIKFDITDEITKPLRCIRDKGISQFPIYRDGELVGLLTDNGISNWLANSIDADIISIQETRINDVINNDENRNHFRFVSKHQNFTEIHRMFKEILNLKVLLVTESGSQNQSLLGIITSWDISIF